MLILWLFSLFCSFNVLHCTNSQELSSSSNNPRSHFGLDSGLMQSYDQYASGLLRRDPFNEASILLEFLNMPKEHVFPENHSTLPRRDFFNENSILQEFYNFPKEHVFPEGDSTLAPVPEQPMPRDVENDGIGMEANNIGNVPVEKTPKPASVLPKRLLTHVLNKIRHMMGLPITLSKYSSTRDVYPTAVNAFNELLTLALQANIDTTVHGVTINLETIEAAMARIAQHRESGFVFSKSKNGAKKLLSIICGVDARTVGAPECMRDVAVQLSAYALTLYPEIEGIRFDGNGDLLVDGTRFPTSDHVRQYTNELIKKRALKPSRNTVDNGERARNQPLKWVSYQIDIEENRPLASIPDDEANFEENGAKRRRLR